MNAKNVAPLPEPKPWIRTSSEIIQQAQAMMTPPQDTMPELLEDDPE
jgi:hypothetical protein